MGEGNVEVKTAIGIAADGSILNVNVSGGVQFDRLPDTSEGVPPDVGQKPGEGFLQRKFAGGVRGGWPGGQTGGFGDAHEDICDPVRVRRRADRRSDLDGEGVPRAGVFPCEGAIHKDLAVITDRVESEPDTLSRGDFG